MKKFFALCAFVGVISLCSCSINKMNCISQKHDTATITELDGISKINVDISVGNCTVIVGDSEEAILNTKYQCKAISQEKADTAIINADVNCKTVGDTLYVEFIDKSTGKTLDKVNDGNQMIITTHTEIHLPENISVFDISTEVGDINISDFSGSFTLNSDVGDISANNITITGDSYLTADVGDVKCTASGIEADKTELKTDVGNVDFSIENAGKANVNIYADVGDIILDTNGKPYEEVYFNKDTTEQEAKIIIENNCNIEMNTDVGSIKINK